MPSLTTHTLLRRLSTAAGLAAIPVVYAAGAAGTEDRVRVCLQDAMDDSGCIGAAEALVRLRDGDGEADLSGCEPTAVLGVGTSAASYTCCYPVQVECEAETYEQLHTMGYGGCMGRPFAPGGRPVVAAIVGRGPLGAAPRPGLAVLSATQREILAQFWIQVAQAEHASIAEFHRVALELLRFGAPVGLVRRAQAAAVDETRHASRCLALASTYAGSRLRFGPLPVGEQLELATDLATLTAVTARDGCVAETCSTWLYARLQARAASPRVRAVIAGVVRDETRHAELAWATLRWATRAGGSPAREAAAAALACPPPRTRVPGPLFDDPALAAHGWAPASLQDRFADEGWTRVALPLAREMGLGTAEASSPLPVA